ncbi:hypothetical protein [Thioalkalivibrio denitrificans]|uniref:hypothetical protein n=1 Tax=Thioalkalivibrio denitrificans TaxID=108003 RepID=UPI001115A149|nr:hypothetical protein [Thioalkalivibrio denitrificans]
MIVKVLIALCALVLTFVSFFGNAIDRKGRGALYRRIRVPGYIGIFAATGAFVLVGLDELNQQGKEAVLNSRIQSLDYELSQSNKTLAEAREDVEKSVIELVRLRRYIDLLDRSSRGQLSRIAYVEIPLASLPTVDTPLYQLDGRPIRPLSGDEIKWGVYCRGVLSDGALFPPTVRQGQYFGALIANAYKFYLDDRVGRWVFAGTRETGGQLIYQRPYGSDSWLYETLRDSQCLLSIEVSREFNAIQLEILGSAGYKEIFTGDPRDSILCQTFERLHRGRSCDELLSR